MIFLGICSFLTLIFFTKNIIVKQGLSLLLSPICFLAFSLGQHKKDIPLFLLQHLVHTIIKKGANLLKEFAPHTH